MTRTLVALSVLGVAIVSASCTSDMTGIAAGKNEAGPPQFDHYGPCHSSFSHDHCLLMWQTINDIIYDGAERADYGHHLESMMIAGKIRYDVGVGTGEADITNGIIKVGDIIQDGAWERYYITTHESKHILANRDHSCDIGESGCNRPGDDIDYDYVGLDCANMITGENRYFL